MLFNKYKHYIKEPELLNLKGERIDFLRLKDYIFEKEKELLNTIFSIFNDAQIKGEEYYDLSNRIGNKIGEFHNLLGLEINSIIPFKEKEENKSIVILSYNIYTDFIKVNLDGDFFIELNIEELLKSFIGDLVDSYKKNDLTRNEDDIVLSQLEDKYKALKNAKDIEDFFSDFKEFILSITIRGFQVGYNEKKEEYRKLIFFKGDYKGINFTSFDKDQDISDFLRELQKENILLGYDYIDEYIDDKDGLIYNHLFNIKLKNGIILELNTIGRLREEIKGIFFSFKEKSFEILDFFEKLYAYRKNHIVENTKGKVENILDLLDVSPFNNRLNNKNISRANLVIRSLISNFGFAGKNRELIEAIILNQKKGATIFDSDFLEFNNKVLKYNIEIKDFIFKKETIKFEEIQFYKSKVMKKILESGEEIYIDLDTFEKLDDKRVLGIKYKTTLEIKKEYIKDFILNNKDKITKESFKDHGKKLEYIPDISENIDGKYVISGNKFLEDTYNRNYEEQLKYVKNFNSLKKFNFSEDLELVIPDINLLTYLVLKNLEKINKIRGTKIIRFRSSTRVPKIDGVYTGREKWEDVDGEYYEVVIGDPKFKGKIDIDTGSGDKLGELGGKTILLSVFKN